MKPVLLGCISALIRLPFTVMSPSVAGPDRVVVPQVVVDHLEVPHPLAGLDVERDDRVGEQVVAGAVAAVVDAGGRRQRHVDVAQLGVARDAAPRRQVAGVGVRLVAPGLAPNSPARGTTWNVHSSLPVRASKPRTSSGAASCFTPPSPAPAVAPATTITSLTTIGLAVQLNRPASGWFQCRLTRPLSPKSWMYDPSLAFMA